LPLAALMLVGGCSMGHSAPPMSAGNTAVAPPSANRAVIAPPDAAISAKPGDTVAALLQSRLPSAVNGWPVTLVLVRRGPEGPTRELIDVDASRQLMDPHQNYVLRAGDTLMLPSAAPLPAAADIPAQE